MSTTLGVILGNRNFFPDCLITEARNDLAKLFSELDIQPVWLSPGETKLGSVETWSDALRCGELFRRNRERIEGILVSLPNFGDEKGLSDAIRLSELRVPILVQACPDDLDAFGLQRRRDAFCGKISACNNLRQYGLPYTITNGHTLCISSDQFRDDLTSFLATCRVVKGMRRVRLGAVGARPNAFNTTRFLGEIAGVRWNFSQHNRLVGGLWKHCKDRRNRYACERARG
jgi:L-fucose isomerase-like protein